MSATEQTRLLTKPAPAPSLSITRTGLLQRKCACGGTPGLDGECAECRRKRLTARGSFTRPPKSVSMPGQPGLTVNVPGDTYDQEAHRIAEQVMRTADRGARLGGKTVQRAEATLVKSAEVPANVSQEIGDLRGQSSSSARNFVEPRFGHDFSRVRVETPGRFREARGTHMSADGIPALTSLEESETIFVDQSPIGDVGLAAALAGGGTPVACPTDIRVGQVGVLQMDERFAKAGWRTGWGGFALMEVSDLRGRNWDGVKIHENLYGGTDTCELGEACSNAQGEGGDAGSTFTVGKEADFLGLFKLPATRNAFWDVHVTGMKRDLLTDVGLPSCQATCKQQYDCGGRRFGPEFTITRQFKKDTIKSDANTYGVTRIDLDKR